MSILIYLSLKSLKNVVLSEYVFAGKKQNKNNTTWRQICNKCGRMRITIYSIKGIHTNGKGKKVHNSES